MISQHFIQQRPKRLGVGVELGVKIILDGIIKIQGACNAAGGGQVARVFASACLLPVREECRASYQWCCFFAAAILGLLLGPDKESALLFCFLGYYPLVQPSLDAIGSRALRFLTKLGLYVLAVGAMYALLVFVFRLDAVTAELAATAPWLIAATFALGAVLLFLYDELLRRFARLYRRRKRG